MIAANMKPLYEKEARERQIRLAGTRLTDDLASHGTEGIKGETNEIVGKMFGVSGQTVKRASAVIKNGVEELQEAVKLKPLYVEEAKIRQKASQAKPGEKIGTNVPCCSTTPFDKGEVNKIVGDMLGISKAGKSTFQWIGGCQKYTFFVYIWVDFFQCYVVRKNGYFFWTSIDNKLL